jgi:hypothetical protein
VSVSDQDEKWVGEWVKKRVSECISAVTHHRTPGVLVGLHEVLVTVIAGVLLQLVEEVVRVVLILLKLRVDQLSGFSERTEVIAGTGGRRRSSGGGGGHTQHLWTLEWNRVVSDWTAMQ